MPPVGPRPVTLTVYELHGRKRGLLHSTGKYFYCIVSGTKELRGRGRKRIGWFLYGLEIITTAQSIQTETSPLLDATGHAGRSPVPFLSAGQNAASAAHLAVFAGIYAGPVCATVIIILSILAAPAPGITRRGPSATFQNQLCGLPQAALSWRHIFLMPGRDADDADAPGADAMASHRAREKWGHGGHGGGGRRGGLKWWRSLWRQ
ncbi:hypothetical protein DFH27DRAFT_606237 [Peziza echinospora]|nr:hypothetical protein DFH27DRAFT_606237 [Peziza echinospora]